MTNRSRQPLDAEALQEALERQADLLGKGVEETKAKGAIAAELDGEVRILFALGAGLSRAAAPAPEPRFAEPFAERLRSMGKVEEIRPRGLRRFAWGLPGSGMAAAAAAIAIFAGLLVPAFRSLPGDTLYSIKRASESARIAVVSGPTEARLRMHLAAERFEEVEALVERAQLREVGPGLAAASITQDIGDPRIARLIEETLADAEEQISAAATILTAVPTDVRSLDDLVVISQRGRELVEMIAADLPASAKPPVLSTGVSLAKIQAQAKAAKMVAQQSQQSQQPREPKLEPCDTPTPTPTPTETPSETPATSPESPDASPAASPQASPTASPTATPEPTPCISPSPTPTPDPTPTPTPTESPEQVAEAPTPTPTTEGSATSEPRNAEPAWRGTSPQPGSSGSPTEA